ncbi:aroma-sacti cluster domain-containing protein [Phytohabitans kaempferiae]|uniref:Aroma-sacti cluster domain-containing protein n=1 Tax=Phytohabitans kaempferiae TaxID=1620943 RepID=A0ABV6M542_9ACTN
MSPVSVASPSILSVLPSEPSEAQQRVIDELTPLERGVLASVQARLDAAHGDGAASGYEFDEEGLDWGDDPHYIHVMIACCA